MAVTSALDCRIHDGPLPREWWGPAAVVRPGHGGVGSFVGVVRDHARGRAVTALHYECYRPMAQRMLERIAAELAERFDPALALFMAHGIGAMVPGDVAVCIHVSSAHRGPALDAPRHAIERIKQDLPVWKRQTYCDGESEWLPGA